MTAEQIDEIVNVAVNLGTRQREIGYAIKECVEMGNWVELSICDKRQYFFDLAMYRALTRSGEASIQKAGEIVHDAAQWGAGVVLQRGQLHDGQT